MSPCTLVDALAAVPDPRSKHGLIHPLAPFLGLVALAMLMGRTSLNGIARFGRQHGPALAHALGFRRGKTPAVSTLSRTLRRFDADQLEHVLSYWIASRVDPAAFTHISIDGKTFEALATARSPVSTCWPHTPPPSVPYSPRSRSMRAPTSTRPP
ncbi:transposase family protein [Gemmata obscuriglobus]|uniref:transposase family protein n=1 Tax=Gemmata obscuriglobus TaxID=114 RepID=UPI00137BA5F8|nr:transposase family protein [Gemmata obscuriglobus]VTS08273.1 Transposase IS4 family protein OS=Streptomyces pratensis (strain ATCC 33331 / IAF-45CD) GN=Sfla_6458 PE=4 SV=1: DDE_Tnp_1_assoc [Gemmata obscuriglobus UQM 2246]